MENIIKNETEKIIDKVICIRRKLHKYPETALKECKTSKIIADILEDYGIEIQRNVAGTGVVGIIYGNNPGKTIAIRADIDALNIEEKNEVDYKSIHEGYMHACGHDGHIAMALGAAMVLKSLESQIFGNIKFIFQPAEEQYGGAERMIINNVLEYPRVDSIIALHLWPDLPKGTIGIKDGCIMASNDRFEIKIHGESAHGAMPHLGKDSVVIGAQIVNAVQGFIAREINPLDSAVITIGTFTSGTAYNIIAKEANLTGTVRTTDEAARDFIEGRLKKIISGICLANDVGFEFNYIRQYPATINNLEMTDFVKKVGEDVFGKSSVINLKKPYMTAEDFAYYLKRIPGCMCFLGTYDDKNTYPLHHEKFNFDEKVLKSGVTLLVASAIRFLQ